MLLVGIPSGISTWQLGRARELSKGVLALLVGGPIFDSIIAFWLFELVGVSGPTLWVGALCIGIISHIPSATIVSSSTTDYVAVSEREYSTS